LRVSDDNQSSAKQIHFVHFSKLLRITTKVSNRVSFPKQNM
jgi:hypothetical protein